MTPADPACGWPRFLDAADEHALMPALWSTLVARGVRSVPAGMGDEHAPLAVLEHAYRQNAARVTDLAAQGTEILDAFLAEGIEALPLKGWHGLLVGRWPDPAARVMVDLDVLVDEHRVERARRVLTGLGYRDLGVEDPERLAGHQVAPLGRVGRAGSVELHRAVLVPRRADLLPAREVLAGAITVSVAGTERRVPCATHAMTIVIAHAQLQDDGARLFRLPLRALAETAVMVHGIEGAQVDWDEVSARFARARASGALAGFATALEDLFAVRLPVSRRGGWAWWAATSWLLDSPRTARLVRETVSLPRALSSERMARLHGADTAFARARARTGHLVRGARRRLTGA